MRLECRKVVYDLSHEVYPVPYTCTSAEQTSNPHSSLMHFKSQTHGATWSSPLRALPSLGWLQDPIEQFADAAYSPDLRGRVAAAPTEHFK